MRWYSRLFRNGPAGRLAMTIVPGGGQPPEAMQRIVELLDRRRLPAAWAVVTGGDGLPLAHGLLASKCPHELAYLPAPASLSRSMPSLLAERVVASRIGLPLRTFVDQGAGVHPSLLARLGVTALVPVGSDAPRSRTGQLRSVAWGIWEAPLTVRLSTHDLPEAREAMLSRLAQLLEGSRGMHLLWQIDHLLRGERQEVAIELLDLVAEFCHRDWLEVQPVGAIAEAQSRMLQSAA